MNLKCNDWCPSRKKEGEILNTETQRERLCAARDRLEPCSYTPRMWRAAGTCWKLGRRLEQTVPQDHQKKPMLSSPWFQLSGLQHSERINVQCFKPSALVIDYDSCRQLTRTEIFSSHFFFSAVPWLPALYVTWEKSEVQWLSNSPGLASYLTLLPGGFENFFFMV